MKWVLFWDKLRIKTKHHAVFGSKMDKKTKVIWSKKNFIESMAKIQDPHTRARGDQTAVAHARGGGGKSNLSEQGDASEHIYSTHGEDMASAKNFGSFSTKNTI